MTNTLTNSYVANINWSSIPEGLIELRTLRSFRRHPIDRDYIDPYVLKVYEEILTPRLLYDVKNYWRPNYDPDIFLDNLLKFKSPRRAQPNDWESFQRYIDSDYHYEFRSHGFFDFSLLDTNWQAAAGFGYGNKKKGDFGVKERAFKTACVLALEYHKGNRLTLDEYTPDLALVKPEPSPSSKSKLRPVWGVAYHNWILSALGGQPAMKAVPSLLDGYPLVHNIDPSKDIPLLYSQLNDKYPDHHWYQIDWSSLDADVQLFESNTYDQRMNERISFNGDELAASCWKFSTDWRSHGTVVSPSGTKYVRNGNVGSGDTLTYHKDSEVAHRRLRYLLKDFESDFCPKQLILKCGGDDGIIGVPRNVQLPIKKLSHDAEVTFNSKLNGNKFEYSPTPLGLSLFKTEVNPGFHAQRKEDTVAVLGRTLCPLGTIEHGSLSTARVRMINDATGWSNPYLLQTFFKLKRLYGEADRSEMPTSWLRAIERAGIIKYRTNTHSFSKQLADTY